MSRKIKLGKTEIIASSILANELKSARYNKALYKWTSKEIDWKLNEIQSMGGMNLTEESPFLVNCNPKREDVLIGPHDLWVVARKTGNHLLTIIYVDIADIEEEKRLSQLVEKAYFERNGKSYSENLEKILPLDKICKKPF